MTTAIIHKDTLIFRNSTKHSSDSFWNCQVFLSLPNYPLEVRYVKYIIFRFFRFCRWRAFRKLGEKAILINNGIGDFTAVDTIGGQTNAQALAAGDWDGDDDLDLAVANFGASRVDILENQP